MQITRSLAFCLVSWFVVTERSAAADSRADYVHAIADATGDIVQPTVVDKLITFNVGASCWKKLLDKDQKGIYSGYSLAHNIADWAKVVTGNDWWEIERKTDIDAEQKRATLEKMITAFKSKFSLTITIDGNDCNPKNASHHVVAWEVIGGALRDYPPKSGKAFIALRFGAKAKGVSATASKDGTKFTITLPRDREPDVWQKPVLDAFRKASAKKE